MRRTSAFLERIFPALPELESFATGLEASRAEAAGRLVDGIRHLSALVEVSETVTQSFSLDHQLPRLIELITELLGAERATLFLHDPESGELFSRVAQGEGLTEIRVSDSDGIVGSVFGSGVSEIIADAYTDTRFNRERSPDGVPHPRSAFSAAAQPGWPSDGRHSSAEQALGDVHRNRCGPRGGNQPPSGERAQPG